MIASVRGVVLTVGLDSAVLEVGGVGLLVHTTPGTAAGLRRGTEARLATTMVVREESLTLYGFADDDEKVVFEQVQTVSGVGPRLALAMLAVHAPDVLRQAVSTGDLAALTKVPGIGKKGAERLVLELRDRIGPVGGSGAQTPLSLAVGGIAWQEQVRQALVGLGWSAAQADQAVGVVATDLGTEPAPAVPILLKRAIQILGRS
jgi:Holliday junction DNA helicase RuvA